MEREHFFCEEKFMLGIVSAIVDLNSYIKINKNYDSHDFLRSPIWEVLTLDSGNTQEGGKTSKNSFISRSWGAIL